LIRLGHSLDATATLLHPLATGLVDWPGKGARVLFLGAQGGFLVGEIPKDVALTCVQGFRPQFRALMAAGYSVVPLPEGESYDASLILCGRHRGQNESWIAQAVARSKPGALILVAGGKEDGTASLRKRLTGIVTMDGGVSKYHGVAFWFRRPPEPAGALSAFGKGAEVQSIDGRFAAAPGMFSHDRVDAGSRLLAEHLPGDLSGKVADFCAGWGYLGWEVLQRCPKVKSLDLYEADFASLEAAKANLSGAVVPVRSFWHDLDAESVGERYDAIVMNPPFHADRKADPLLGQAMIKAAAGALKSGGRLFLVANRQLPYERALAGHFASFEQVADAHGFKVIAARK
jgi:16S rRNA (guanine1207-N2)-methyltransferase